MKYKIILISLLSLSLLLSSCTKPVEKDKVNDSIPAQEHSQEKETPILPTVEEKDEKEGEKYRDILLNENNLATNKEVFHLFSFLLENGAALTPAELANVQDLVDDYDNVFTTYFWYSQKELSNIKLEILESRDLGSRSTGGQYDEYRDGESYYLKVNVTDAGESTIPLGEQEWVFGTILPMYGLDALTPNELITFEEYKLRQECENHINDTDLIKSFIKYGINEAFNSFSEISDDKLIHYILSTVDVGEDGSLTQEEVNQYAKELFDIDSLAPTDSESYNPDTKTFTPLRYGPPYPYDYFKRVVEEGEGIHFDYVGEKTALRYTIREGKLVSATDISEESSQLEYGEITGKDQRID